MGMAAGSSRRKIKGGGGVLPIVTWNWVIRDCCFRTKKKSRGAGSFGTCYEFPGRGSRSFSPEGSNVQEIGTAGSFSLQENEKTKAKQQLRFINGTINFIFFPIFSQEGTTITYLSQTDQCSLKIS